MNAEKISVARLFEKDIEILFNEKTKLINGFVNSQQIKHDLTPEGLERIKDTVFERLWKWPDIQIDRSKIKRDSKDVLLSPDDALEVLYPGKNQIEFAFHKATLAIYTLPYTGASDALHYSTKGNGFEFTGSSSGSNLEVYLYTNKEITEEIALEIRSKRDKILDRIDKVLHENRSYVTSKVEDFKKLISDLVDNSYYKEKKRNDINNLL